MNRYAATDHDNRNSDQMYDYLEARIDALKQRISELESDNEALRNARGTMKPVPTSYAGALASHSSRLRH